MIKEIIEKKIDLPKDITAEVSGSTVSVKGMGKEAKRQLKANGISFRQENNSIVVVGKPASRKINALINTIASHINNMVSGLDKDYVYKLTVVYSHFPMNVTVKGRIVEIKNFVGEKKPRNAKIVEGTTVTIKGKEVVVKSHNKEAAGQTAANLENATKVRGKDKRIYQDGIFIVEKGLREEKESK